MQDFAPFRAEFQKIKEHLARAYVQLHAGQATPSLLDGVVVESYGAPTKIKNVASITIEDPRTLRVIPWDRSLLREIERALHAANMGLSVSADEQGVRAMVPVPTTERREAIVKLAKEKLEEARISLRQAREDALTHLKEAHLPEDRLFKSKEQLQTLVDESNKELEALFVRKEQEVRS